MTDHERFCFEPLFNLQTARVVGFEVKPRNPRDQVGVRAVGTVWGTRQIVDLDAGIALASLAFATDYDATVPLHVNVLADTVVAARRRLRSMLDGLAQREQVMPPVVLEVNPAASAAPVEALVEGLHELRSWGFQIALDAVGRGFGLDLVPTIRPDLVKLDEHLVAGLTGGGTAEVVVQAVCDVCAAVGTRIAATGVATRDQLAELPGRGVSWAQGPLLDMPRRRPSTGSVPLPPELIALTARRTVTALPGAQKVPSPRPRPRPTVVRDLAQAAVSLPDTSTADAARRALADHPLAGGLVLLDGHRRPTGYLDRNRFMLAISGPYGRALYASRPAKTLAEAPRLVDELTPVQDALAASLRGDRARSYDDVVLTAADGTCSGVVRVADLLRDAPAPAA
ncbi:EAL domain-containing protein [Pseudonocardia acidicola]|uniref:EAL domain-containing protein n=1 Tax=Pseudonocardia acidicola TaxID=2724939 RepID=A0ABX1SCE0_9PSEU|nr:EAL domain-containing protein [Pseudonocardia acidicola]NMH98564.1 EAL domain-containing protein [Pseudonocardia acidicola]